MGIVNWIYQLDENDISKTCDKNKIILKRIALSHLRKLSLRG